MKKLALLVSLVFLIGCSEKSNYENYQKISSPPRKIRLKAKKIEMAGINIPYTFEILGKYCIVFDIKSDEFVKIVDLESNRLLRSFGRKGQGPDEFIAVSSILPDIKNKDCFWIYDAQLKRLSKFDIRSLIKGHSNPEEIIKLQMNNSGYINQLLLTPSSQLLGIGFFLKGRIAIYAMDGRFIKNIGRIPVEPNNESFAMNYSHAFSGNIAVRDESKEVFIAIKLGSIIEKYNMNGDLIATYVGPETFYPEYNIVQTGMGPTMTYNEKTRVGYIDICYNKKRDRIFLLYSGRYKFDKARNLRTNGGDIIYVMDANGKFEAEYELTNNIYQLRVSDDGNVLFGTFETGLYKFELNDQHGGKISKVQT
jgi:hypothetical protein